MFMDLVLVELVVQPKIADNRQHLGVIQSLKHRLHNGTNGALTQSLYVVVCTL